jgi:hypothetical protein
MLIFPLLQQWEAQHTGHQHQFRLLGVVQQQASRRLAATHVKDQRVHIGQTLCFEGLQKLLQKDNLVASKAPAVWGCELKFKTWRSCCADSSQQCLMCCHVRRTFILAQ